MHALGDAEPADVIASAARFAWGELREVRRRATIDGMGEQQGPFRFRVTAVFTITGRGLVAAGLTEEGTVRTDDHLVVQHGQVRTTTTCRGVEMIHSDGSVDSRTIGLLLPDLTKDEVAAGDLIESV